MSNQLVQRFRMPAEWDIHAATLVAWPHEVADWPGKFGPIPWVYAEIVRRLAESEAVLLLVQPGAEKSVRALLGKTRCDVKQVTFLEVPTDRVWMRDSGPIGVFDNERMTLLDWQFSAWAKYENWSHDNEIGKVIARQLNVPTHAPQHGNRGIVLEGGGIDVNGAGLVLTTEEWLLSDAQVRNPGLTRADYEAIFAEFLGANTTIWLGRGIVGDDTHGHVDDIARFVGPRTVITAVEKSASDPNHELLENNLQRLRQFRDAAGTLHVIDLPMPDPIFFRKQRLPASYANFYIANSAVLVPTFNDPNDRIALGILADLFPARRVIGIHAVDLVWGLGTLHCLTQQIPAAL
ncbi:MAG: agmatine/peptidylarginine deiminase [Gemmataceae bacterium]